jgi:hypothetical protein
VASAELYIPGPTPTPSPTPRTTPRPRPTPHPRPTPPFAPTPTATPIRRQPQLRQLLLRLHRLPLRRVSLLGTSQHRAQSAHGD